MHLKFIMIIGCKKWVINAQNNRDELDLQIDKILGKDGLQS